MNVLVVEPGFLPYEKEIKDGADHLEQMQAIVGGLIEPIYPYHEEVAISATRRVLSTACLSTAASPEATAAFSARSSFAVWARRTFVLFRPN